MKKQKKLIWGVNAVIFAAVVFFGIEQASLGTTVSSLEGKVEDEIIKRQQVSESIYALSTSENIEEKAQTLGFVKPDNIIYLKSDEVVAKLPTR